MPHAILELAKDRSGELHYRNVGRYFVGMVLADLMKSGNDARVVNTANADPDIQDFLVDQFLKLPIEQAELAKFLRAILAARAKNGNGNGKKHKKRS